MKLSEFILLNEEQKKVTVLHEGVFIAKRNSYSHLVFLFQMDNYYVESYCNIENKSIEEYRVFRDMAALHPYLESISLSDLLN